MIEFSIFILLFTAGIIAWNALVTTAVVHEGQSALLFRHGKFHRLLEPGRHRFIGSGHEVKSFDTRSSDLAICGQEFLTADKAGLKVSAVVEYHIADPLLFHRSAANPLGSLYHAVQIALRQQVGGQTLEALVEKKADFSAALLEDVRPHAARLGLVLDRVAVRDLMIGGDLKKVFTEALAARQQSLVTLEKARAEAAAIRTLANAARVFETHPALLQLKFLQALEKADGGIAQPLALGTAGQWLDFLKK